MFGSALRASWEDDVPRLGASLAYYTLFAIAPVLLVATAIAGLAFGPQAVNLSLGRVTDGTGTFTLTQPTPGTANVSVAVMGGTARTFWNLSLVPFLERSV